MGLLSAVGLVLLLAGCVTEPQPGTPSVRVYDQEISGDTVVVDRVVSMGGGWIVIHAQRERSPGPVMGYAPVADGVNRRVKVKVEGARAGDALYAMLHTDAGLAGTYEFPGADAPVTSGGRTISPRFRLNAPPQESSGNGGY